MKHLSNCKLYISIEKETNNPSLYFSLEFTTTFSRNSDSEKVSVNMVATTINDIISQST